MIDELGRSIDYIRLSITDRCSLRCTYCMPEQGVAWLPHDRILRYEELLRLCRIFVSLGIVKFKITGGEPLVRKGAADFIRALKQIDGVESVTLTTNGTELKAQLPALLDAGIDGLNLSLDTLDRARYSAITRRDCLGQVLEGLNAALAVPGLNLKINCVALPDARADWIALASLAKDAPIAVRFIELMPIGMGQSGAFCTEEEVSAALQGAFGALTPDDTPRGNGPARYYALPDFSGRIGFISPMSHAFCEQCSRVRLTSSGYLKTCLQYETGADLAALLSEPDETIRAAIIEAIGHKPASHQFRSAAVKNAETHIMSQIGG